MATKNEKNTKKSKKLGLKIGLILGLAALFVLVGFLITGSIVFARNAIALLLLGGAGVGIATPVVKGIKSLINKDKDKAQTQTRTLNRNRNQEQTLEDIPEVEEELQETEVYTGEVEVLPKETQTRTNGRGK